MPWIQWQWISTKNLNYLNFKDKETLNECNKPIHNKNMCISFHGAHCRTASLGMQVTGTNCTHKVYIRYPYQICIINGTIIFACMWPDFLLFKGQMNLYSIIFIQENAFENVIWKMTFILSRPQCRNSLRSADACKHQWTESSLVHLIAKLFSKQILAYCQ